MPLCMGVCMYMYISRCVCAREYVRERLCMHIYKQLVAINLNKCLFSQFSVQGRGKYNGPMHTEKMCLLLL